MILSILVDDIKMREIKNTEWKQVNFTGLFHEVIASLSYAHSKKVPFEHCQKQGHIFRDRKDTVCWSLGRGIVSLKTVLLKRFQGHSGQVTLWRFGKNRSFE